MVIGARSMAAVGAIATAVVIACNSVLGIDSAVSEQCLSACPAGIDPSCSTYCTAVMSNCTAPTFVAYQSCDVCCTMCGVYLSQAQGDYGSQSDTTGNNIYCRINHALAAANDPATECPNAGPLGGTACVNSADTDPCATFCALDLAFCSAGVDRPACSDGGLIDPADLPYTDGGCLDLCEAYVYQPAAQVLAPANNSTNTLNCRQYHLQNYLSSCNPMHCQHTDVESMACTLPAGQ
jgi:hypothetical protein